MNKALFATLGLFVLAVLLIVGAPAQTVSAQAPPDADPGEILFVKVCEDEAATVIDPAGTFTIGLDTEVHDELILDEDQDEDEVFDTSTTIGCGDEVGVSVFPTLDFTFCNTTGPIIGFGYNPFAIAPSGQLCQQVCDEFDLTVLGIVHCGFPEMVNATLEITEPTIVGVVSTLDPACAGLLDLVDGTIAGSAPTALHTTLSTEGLVCTITNVFDAPDLTVTKLCPNGAGTSTFTAGVTGETAAAIGCGAAVSFPDIATGTVNVSETISGTDVFATGIFCVVNGSQVSSSSTAVAITGLTYGQDVVCAIVNNRDLDPTDGVPPTPPTPGGTPTTISIGPITIEIPITIANTNTNTNNNTTTNTNSTTNTNTTTNTNSNSQTQTNSQNQSSGQDQAAIAEGGALAVSPHAILGHGGVPEVKAGAHRVTPPSTGDAGLASSESSTTGYVLAAMVATLLAGFAVLKVSRD